MSASKTPLKATSFNAQKAGNQLTKQSVIAKDTSSGA